jgi:methionine-rich copper-binding protein CopC
MRLFLTRFPALAALAFISYVLPAHAHAILLSASPAPNESVSGPSVKVTLRFNSRVDAKRSKLLLVPPEGPERSIAAVQPAADILTSDLKDLVPGSYIIRWQVLAVDGHITRGEVPFRVK